MDTLAGGAAIEQVGSAMALWPRDLSICWCRVKVRVTLAISWIGLSAFLLPGLSLFHAMQGSQAHSSGGQQMEGGVVHATTTAWLMW